jgi:hypothetical protein
MDVTFRYGATEPQHDFSRTIQVRPPAAPQATRVFFPAYSHAARGSGSVRSGYALAGIDVPSSAADCVAQVARVRDTRELPVLMNLALPPRWQDATLYGTLSDLEDRRNGDQPPPVYTFPPDLVVQRSLMLSAIQPFERGDVTPQSGRVEIGSDGTWRVSGVGGRGKFLYLAEVKPRAVRRGSTVLAQGRLVRGGISFGLIRHGEWVAQVNVTVPGGFIAVVQAPEDADYEVALGNYVLGASLRYDVEIDRAGWVVDSVQLASQGLP